MRNLLWLAAATVACALSSTNASAANLVTNGGFDSGLSGYTVTPGTDIGVTQGFQYVYDVGGDAAMTGSPAQYANYFATFGEHNADNVSSLLTNTFNTVAGATYKLSFDYGQFDSQSGGPQTLSFAVGNLSSSITNPNVSINLATLFKSYSYTFIGTGSPMQVAFSLAPSGTFRTDGLLDNISVVAAVPEMSTWAMFFLGLGGAGAVLRRRRSLTAGALAAA